VGPDNDTSSWSHAEIEAASHLLFREGRAGGLRPGSFSTALIEALAAADARNRARLLTAFPEFARPLQVMQTRGGTVLSEMIQERRMMAGEDQA